MRVDRNRLYAQRAQMAVIIQRDYARYAPARTVRRRRPGHFLEHAAEIIGIFNPDLPGDFLDRQRRAPQQLLGTFHADSD